MKTNAHNLGIPISCSSIDANLLLSTNISLSILKSCVILNTDTDIIQIIQTKYSNKLNENIPPYKFNVLFMQSHVLFKRTFTRHYSVYRPTT